ncbi:hypothetical protein QQF64_027688 [Cirrhinus molitorella]|uniref:Uncharacterized protein n=1 Tax=Cirrhinus molitorella TaxID=172907 RepID=A0ABR3ND54_9TELE
MLRHTAICSSTPREHVGAQADSVLPGCRKCNFLSCCVACRNGPSPECPGVGRTRSEEVGQWRDADKPSNG